MTPIPEEKLVIDPEAKAPETADQTAEIQLPRRYIQYDLPQALSTARTREFISAPEATSFFEILCRFGHRETLQTLLKTRLKTQQLIGLSPDQSEISQRENAAKEQVLDQVMPNWREIK